MNQVEMTQIFSRMNASPKTSEAETQHVTELHQ
jgi:hypothetical protein